MPFSPSLPPILYADAHTTAVHGSLSDANKITDIESLEAAYRSLIPISEHLGVRVKSWQDDRLVLTAPLAPNTNHQGSGFGGSLFSIAALAGWGLIQLSLAQFEGDSNTVIANGDVSFKAPVYEPFDCICELPDAWKSCEQTLRDNGRASLILTPRVMVNDTVAMTLSGRYVISLKS